MRIAWDGNVARVQLEGELDIDWKSQHEAEIRELCLGSQGTLIFDFRDVTFIDSTGIGVLAQCAQPKGSDNCSAYIVGANSNVKEALEIVGLTNLLQPVDSEGEVTLDR
jgi:anti-anti-sigma factor